jgi:hypothetical protein
MTPSQNFIGIASLFSLLGFGLAPSVALADEPRPASSDGVSKSAAKGEVPVTVTGGGAESGGDPWDGRWSRCNGIDDGAVRASTGCTGVFGLRGSLVDVSGAPSGDGAGLMFSAEGEEYWRRKIWSSRGQYWAGLGGGGAGLEGALAGAIAFGFRAPVTENMGPVVRAGAKGYLLGNDAFYGSLIELPQVQLGWQWSRGHALVELAGTSGVALVGRFRAGSAPMREIGRGFALGGQASVQIPWVRLSLEAEHLPTSDGISTPVDVARGTLCAVAAPVAICADGRTEQSRALVAGVTPVVRANYAGLTIGLTGER